MVKVTRSLSGSVLSRVKAYWERSRGRSVFRAITRRHEMKMVVLAGGKWLQDHMDAVQIQQLDVMAAAREKGIQRAEEIEYAIVKRNGQISIIQKKADLSDPKPPRSSDSERPRDREGRAIA